MAEQVSVDQRAAELDQREAKLDRREAELDKQKSELDQQKAELDQQKAELDQLKVMLALLEVELNQREAAVMDREDKVCADRADLRKWKNDLEEQKDEQETIHDILTTQKDWLSQQEADHENRQIANHQLQVDCDEMTALRDSLAGEINKLTAECARKRKGATHKETAWPSAHVQEQSNDTKRLAALAECVENVTKAATAVAADKDALDAEKAALEAEKAALKAEKAMVTMQLAAKCAQLTAECARKRKGATRNKNAWLSAHVQKQEQSNDTKRLAALAECVENVTKAATAVAADKDALDAEKAALEAEKAALKAEKAMVTMQLDGLAEWRLELEEIEAFQTRCAEAMATPRPLLEDNEALSR